MANNKSGVANLKSNKLILGIIIALAILLFVMFFSIAKNISQTETYYVLNQDVPTRTQIVPEMLEPVTTSAGTAPKAAIGIQEVQAGLTFSRFPLQAQEILTASNTAGDRTELTTGIPDEWVVTNISVAADKAVGGSITRGKYFDIMVANEVEAFYPFINLLTLDTSISLNSASAGAIDTEESKSGQTSQYFIGLSPENAAKMQVLFARYGSDIQLVESPKQNEYNSPLIEDYEGTFSYDPNNDGTIWPGEVDGREITDKNFTVLDRNKDMSPKDALVPCSLGNLKLYGDDCKGLKKNSKKSSDTGANKNQEPVDNATGENAGGDEANTEANDTTGDAGTQEGNAVPYPEDQ